MLQKRGQLTIFIILLFVVGISVFFIVSLGNEEVDSSIKTDIGKELSVDDRNIRKFAEECVTKTAKDALFYLGFIGGNLKPDPFEIYYNFDNNFKVPYFYFEGNNDIPVPYMESYWTNLIDRYINNNLYACIDNFESFKGTKIDFGRADSSTEFTDESVIFNVNFPVIITRDFQSTNLEPRYIDEINVRLRDILKFTTTIVEKEVKDDKYIHWDFLTQIGADNYNITAYTEEDNTIIYRIIDLENKIDNEVYVFQFANKIRVKRV